MKLFVFVIALFICSTSLYAGCDKDTDCKGDRICVKGECEFQTGENHKNDNPSWRGSENNNADNREKMELYQKLLKAKKNRTGSIVGMSLGFGLGVNSVISGGLLFAKVSTNETIFDMPTTAIIFMVTGGIEIIAGFVSAGLYVRNNRRVHEYSKEYDMKYGAIFENGKISINIPKPVLLKDRNGEYYGLSVGFSL